MKKYNNNITIKDLGSSFWQHHISKKIQLLSLTDQQEAAQDLLVSHPTLIDEILSDYNQEVRVSHITAKASWL